MYPREVEFTWNYIQWFFSFWGWENQQVWTCNPLKLSAFQGGTTLEWVPYTYYERIGEPRSASIFLQSHKGFPVLNLLLDFHFNHVMIEIKSSRLQSLFLSWMYQSQTCKARTWWFLGNGLSETFEDTINTFVKSQFYFHTLFYWLLFNKSFDLFRTYSHHCRDFFFFFCRTFLYFTCTPHEPLNFSQNQLH